MNSLNPIDDPTNSPVEPNPAAIEKHAAAQKSTWVSVAVNLSLTITQVIAGLLAHSQGLISDGIHSLSDLVADFVVLFANLHSRKAADDDHQYGHQRYETAASLFLGGLLIAVGVGMFWKATERLLDIDSIPPVKTLGLWVALGALIAKESLFRYMLAIATRVRSGMLIANAWHARSDAASSLVVAVGIIGNMMGHRILDPIAAIVVGLMVVKMGWSFAADSFNDLMDRAVNEETLAQISDALTGTAGVLGFHDLRTRKMGDMVLADAHIEVDANITVVQGHDIAESARSNVLQIADVLEFMAHVDPVLLPTE